MTELDFLIELLLNHKLNKFTKDYLQGRIKEIQSAVKPFSQPINYLKEVVSPIAQGVPPPVLPMSEVNKAVPYAQIAQTPIAAAALQARESLLMASEAGKNIDKDTGRPRKF